MDETRKLILNLLTLRFKYIFQWYHTCFERFCLPNEEEEKERKLGQSRDEKGRRKLPTEHSCYPKITTIHAWRALLLFLAITNIWREEEALPSRFACPRNTTTGNNGRNTVLRPLKPPALDPGFTYSALDHTPSLINSWKRVNKFSHLASSVLWIKRGRGEF